MGNLLNIILFVIFSGGFLSLTAIAKEDSEFNQGVMAMSQNDYETAIVHFENDLKHTVSYEAYYNLGLSFFENGNLTAALWAMEYAYYLNPSSKDAKFNAAQILQYLNPDKTWEDPFSNWTKFTVRIGALFWLMFSILLSVSLGLLFFMVNTSKHLNHKKQLLKALALAGLLLVFSVVAGKHASNHFEYDHFVLPKTNEVSTFVSPDGLTLDEKLILGNRYLILERKENWLKIEFETEHPLWVNTNDVFYY
ncbi:MAG: tetratricopeptide repeat protein [Crocinitomicaceae bacterium]|nr:tetratricopeptide repeat protein [Crocinitomicaceae bacterium]